MNDFTKKAVEAAKIILLGIGVLLLFEILLRLDTLLQVYIIVNGLN